jgi:hypothetical protein
VTLALAEAQQQQLATASAIVAEADDLVVDSLPMAEHAQGFLRDLRARRSRIEAMHDDIVNPLKAALAGARKWFLPSLAAHDQAEVIVKGKLASFTLQEQERAAAERRAREDAERKAREAAEREAAAARERARVAAEEASRKAQEAAEREQKAREEGNHRAAAAAAAERARRDEEARQKVEEGERKAAEAQLAAAAQAGPEVREAAKVAGFGLRDAWSAEATVEETEAVRLIAAALAARPELAGLLKLDMPAANRMAKALRKNFNVPGLKAVNKPVPVSRG